MTMNQNPPGNPIACNLSNLDDAARSREQELLVRFRTILTEATRSGDHYRFTLPSDRATLADLGEFMALERLCCPFLRFQLSVDASDRATLEIDGPEGTGEFLERILELSN
jgi:hypothetical protein